MFYFKYRSLWSFINFFLHFFFQIFRHLTDSDQKGFDSEYAIPIDFVLGSSDFKYAVPIDCVLGSSDSKYAIPIDFALGFADSKYAIPINFVLGSSDSERFANSQKCSALQKSRTKKFQILYEKCRGFKFLLLLKLGYGKSLFKK